MGLPIGEIEELRVNLIGPLPNRRRGALAPIREEKAEEEEDAEALSSHAASSDLESTLQTLRDRVSEHVQDEIDAFKQALMFSNIDNATCEAKVNEYLDLTNRVDFEAQKAIYHFCCELSDRLSPATHEKIFDNLTNVFLLTYEKQIIDIASSSREKLTNEVKEWHAEVIRQACCVWMNIQGHLSISTRQLMIDDILYYINGLDCSYPIHLMIALEQILEDVLRGMPSDVKSSMLEHMSSGNSRHSALALEEVKNLVKEDQKNERNKIIIACTILGALFGLMIIFMPTLALGTTQLTGHIAAETMVFLIETGAGVLTGAFIYSIFSRIFPPKIMPAPKLPAVNAISLPPTDTTAVPQNTNIPQPQTHLSASSANIATSASVLHEYPGSTFASPATLPGSTLPIARVTSSTTLRA